MWRTESGRPLTGAPALQPSHSPSANPRAAPGFLEAYNAVLAGPYPD